MSKPLSMEDFFNDVDPKKKSDIIDWKQKGRLQVFLHPNSGIRKRHTHWFPTLVEEEQSEGKKGKKGKKKYIIKNVLVVCPNTKSNSDACPICNLRKLLRDRDDIDNDEVILEFDKGDETEVYLKGDILGEDGYDWRKNLMYRKEYLFGVIDVDDPTSIKTLIAPQSLGKEIKRVIQSEMEDEGEEAGDPFKNPYPFKLSYDPDEQPARMYSASKGKAKLTEEIQELLESDGIDLDSLSEPTDPKEILKLIKSCLVCDEISIDDLKGSFDTDDEDEEEKPAKTKSKANKKQKVEDDEEEDFEDSDEDEETDDEDFEDDEDAEAEEDAEEEEEEFDNEDDEEEDIKSKKSAKNKSNDKRRKKVEDDEEDEEPKKKNKKKENKKSKKVKEDEDEDEEEEYDTCPACGKKIKPDATECPHCGAEFDEDEDNIECPKCGKTVPITKEKCPHCGFKITLF